MLTEELRTLACDAIADLKGIDIYVMDVRDLSTITDVMIVCTGTSTRHVKSIAENIIKKAKEQQLHYIRSEGEREGEWVVVDLAYVIIHVMLPATRGLYQL